MHTTPVLIWALVWAKMEVVPTTTKPKGVGCSVVTVVLREALLSCLRHPRVPLDLLNLLELDLLEEILQAVPQDQVQGQEAVEMPRTTP